MSDINEQNETLIEQLLAGDTSIRDKLIETNRPLVHTTVKRVLNTWTRFRYLRDDLIGVGLLALVQAIGNEVKRLEAGGVKRPLQNYLITSIRSKLLNEFEKQVAHYQTHQYVDTYRKVPNHNLAADDPIFDQIEDREFLLSLCESDREQEIVTLFLEGKRICDIVACTDYTENVIQKTFRRFREKLRNSQDLVSESGSI